jgi:peptidoglycan/LPS O-acetylase OafA/YrhL
LTSLARISIKRYFRLTGPIFISALIVFILMCFKLIYNQEAATIIHREDWLGPVLRFEPDFMSLLRYAFMGVYTNFTPAPPYNPYLWPMAIELAGSFMTFSFLIAYKDLKRPALTAVLAATFLWLFASYFSLFFVGIFFSILRSRNFFTNFRQRKDSTAITACGAILVVVVEWLMEANHTRSDYVLIVQATLFVFCIYGGRWGVSFFSNAVSRYLGRISFSLYLVQFAIITSVTSYLISNYDHDHNLTLQTSFIVIGVSIAAAVVLADIVSRLEQIYLRILDSKVSKWFIESAQSRKTTAKAG